MKNLKNFGTILTKSKQLEINGGQPIGGNLMNECTEADQPDCFCIDGYWGGPLGNIWVSGLKCERHS